MPFEDDRCIKRSYEDLPPEIDYEDEYWKALSNWLKEEVNWTCEECFFYLGKKKEYLHVHHTYGRHINSPEYLKVLCPKCHAEQKKPVDHSFMKDSAQYQSFFRWKKRDIERRGLEDALFDIWTEVESRLPRILALGPFHQAVLTAGGEDRIKVTCHCSHVAFSIADKEAKREITKTFIDVLGKQVQIELVKGDYKYETAY